VSLSVGAEPTCGRGVIAEGDLLPANGCGSSLAMDVCELAAVGLDPVPIAPRLLPIAATIVTAIGM
jgi:hypothetical protein